MSSRIVCAVLVASAIAAFGWSVSAQEGGREHSMTGCLMRAGETQKKDPSGNALREASYRLMNIEGTGPKIAEISQAPKSLPLYANHKIQVTGTQVQGPDKAMHYMRVTMIRDLANDCDRDVK